MGMAIDNNDTEARPRRLHNPFPRPPAGLHFVRGHLHSNPLTSSRTLAAGKHFLVSWDSTHAILTVHHRLQPERALWATPRLGSFLAAAYGESIIHESRGSYSLHDKADLLLSHQTVEDVTDSVLLNHPAQAYSDSGSVCLGRGDAKGPVEVQERDPDGTPLDDSDTPIVLITGCLYSSCELATDELWRFHNGNRRDDAESPFYEPGLVTLSLMFLLFLFQFCVGLAFLQFYLLFDQQMQCSSLILVI